MTPQKRAEFLAKKLWQGFVAGDFGQRVSLTGAIIPHGTLKSGALRRGLSWVESLENKFVTLAVARRTVVCMEKKYHLSVPFIPGASKQQWRETQAHRIEKLSYRAKKTAGHV